MAIAFDSSADLWNSTGTSWTPAAYTCSGSDRVIFIVVADRVWTTSLLTGITYGGNAMTLVDGYWPSDRYSSLWMLVNPPSGSNSFVLSASSSTYMEAYCASYTWVDSSGQPNAFWHVNSSTPANLTLTSTLANCWMIAVCHRTGGGAMAAGAATTIRGFANGSSTGTGLCDSNAPIVSAGSGTLQITSSSTTMAGCFFAPLATSSVNSWFSNFF